LPERGEKEEMPAKAEKLPRGLQVIEQEGQIRLVYRHHRFSGFLLCLAGLFWLAMLWPCYRVLSQDAFGPREMLAFFPFLGAATGFLYVGAAKMLNRTELVFSPTSVRVRHEPLLWPGNLQLPLQRVKGYRVKNDLKPRDIRHRVTVGLLADMDDGKQVPLLRAIADMKAARRLHHEAQSHLEETRRRLAGEPENLSAR
jgi:hypothetical protein